MEYPEFKKGLRKRKAKGGFVDTINSSGELIQSYPIIYNSPPHLIIKLQGHFVPDGCLGGNQTYIPTEYFLVDSRNWSLIAQDKPGKQWKMSKENLIARTRVIREDEETKAFQRKHNL